jgi:hypothetical protein
MGVSILPDDVLSSIFAETFKLKRAIGRHRKNPFEIVASHVNRHWRDVAIHCSSLWCKIDVIPFQSIDLLQIYLVRSQPRLLDIDIKLDEVNPYMSPIREDDTLAPSLVMLIAHVDRWSLFTSGCRSYRTFQQIVIAINPLSAPNLTRCSIYLCENEFERRHLSTYMQGFSELIFTGGTPCLSFFACVGIGIESCWPPLGALTELRLDSRLAYDDDDPPAGPLGGEEFSQLLVSLPSLTVFKLKGPVVSLDTYGNLPQIEFPHLSSLDVDINIDYDLYFLSIISAPQLTTLALGGIPFDHELHKFIAIKWIYKYPILTHLEFNYSNGLEFNPIFAKFFPGITHISFRCCSDTLSTLTALMESGADDDTVHWPQLKTILVKPLKPQWIEPLCEFVTARIKSGNALENIVLSKMDIEGLNENEFLKRNVQLESLT